jgi:methyltransferase (TIGR00027 family)
VLDDVASRSALMVAAYRGRATARPDPVCSDPWAAAISGADGAEYARAMDERFVAMELWVAVRTATLDAHVRLWCSPPHSIPQVVLLGAGFDTRAARLASPGLRFFEVDHPASQLEKRRRVAALPGYPVDAPSYVPCDFEKDDLLERLVGHGFRVDAPAVVLWEGVVSYLTEPAIRATLRKVAQGFHPRTLLLFDHLLKIKKAEGRPEQETHAFFGSLGEKVTFGANDPLPMLYEEGFRYVRSQSFDEACLTLTGTYERSREFRFQRIVLASRTPAGLV